MSPVVPESPDRATALGTLALPLMAASVFVAVISAVALPVSPESPESPETACGLDVAVELAAPVLPVFVAEDCDHAVPELPERATGSSVRLALPPLPPLA